MQSNTQYEYDLVAFIGRFQPFHLAHLDVINKAFELGKHVIILIGSANQPATLKNPWSWTERACTIEKCLTDEQLQRVTFRGIEDRLYSEAQWMCSIQEAVYSCTVKEMMGGLPRVALIGHHKDDSSYYLDSFPQWEYVEVDSDYDYNATDIRNVMFDSTVSRVERLHNIKETQLDKLPEFVQQMCVGFMMDDENDRYSLLIEEHEFYVEHDEKWKGAPYDPTFNCADAFVVQAGHILLVQRKDAPGKGLWALPGGYINKKETCEMASIRELKEETKLKVPVPVLQGSKFASKVFDHPQRSPRGRVYSHAFGYKLLSLDGSGKLQRVKGADDAARAWWFTYDEVRRMRSQLFEDHADIIEYFVGKL
jgi:bifunctional NMN adenylyltransferase/nudix hydrolase